MIVIRCAVVMQVAQKLEFVYNQWKQSVITASSISSAHRSAVMNLVKFVPHRTPVFKLVRLMPTVRANLWKMPPDAAVMACVRMSKFARVTRRTLTSVTTHLNVSRIFAVKIDVFQLRIKTKWPKSLMYWVLFVLFLSA